MKDKIYKKRNLLLLIFLFSSCLINFTNAQIAKDTIFIEQEQRQKVAYGDQPEWMVTGALSSVKSEELEKSFTSNFANTLFGRLPGLTMLQGNGEAGTDSPSFFARGTGTFNNNKLLVIVDGFECMFEQLIPEEVESVTLLKDAAATAIFGRRGANGVLLVTTKRGTNSPLKVNFSMQVGFENATASPDFLDSYDYARLYNEALENDDMPALYSQDDLEAYQSGGDTFYHPNIDWYDQVLRKSAPVSKYNLSFSGGKNKARYFVLLNVLNRQGLLEKTGDLSEFSEDSDYAKYNIRSNMDIDLTDNFSVAFNFGITIVDKSNPAGYTTSDLFDLISSVPPNAFPVYNPDGSLGGNAMYSNPWGNMLQNGLYTSNSRTSESSIRLTHQLYMITEGLSVSAAASFNNSFRGYSAKSRTYERFLLSQDDEGNLAYLPFGQETSLEASENEFDQWRNVTFQSFLNYERIFGKNQFAGTLRYNLDRYTLPGNDLSYKHVGLGGRLTYALNEKYIGEFTFAYNGANGFPDGNRFGFFPAASAGWVVSKENFMKNNSFINYLKLRASYGLVGNDLIDKQRFMYDQYYQQNSAYYYGTTNQQILGYSESQIKNPALSYEKEKELNIGLEAVLLQNFEFSLDLFSQNRSDILTQPNRTVPQFLGMNLPMLNVGKVKNHGFEAVLNYKNNGATDWHYEIGLNVWYAKNKIDYISEPLQQNEYLNKTGQAVDQPFLLEAIGFFRDQDDIINSPKQIFDEIQPGDIKYKDQNGDNIIDQNDFYPLGNTVVPELNFGLHTALTYKNYYLDLFFQGVTNRSIYLYGDNFYAFQNNGKITSMALGRWTDGTVQTASYPRLSSENNLNNYQSSSFWQRDGSFVKLRTAEVGYKLPEYVIDKVHLSGAKIFINGTNLFSIDHIDHADPENLSGYPAVRTLSLGIKIQFE